MPEQQVEFYGEKFTLAGEFSEFALMEFAEAAEGGTAEENTMRSMATMLRLVLDCIDPEQQAQFRAVARKNRAKAEKLMDVLKLAMESATERPTTQPSDSSDGPVAIEAKPATSSVTKISERFAGRPDVATVLVDMAEQRNAV